MKHWKCYYQSYLLLTHIKKKKEMGFKLLLVFLATIVLIQANFTDLQTEFMEMKQELHNLQILVSDIRSEQYELRQLSNDHVIIHWIKIP